MDEPQAQLNSVTLHDRFHNAHRKFVYSNPSGEVGSYPTFVRRVLRDVWNRLEPQFKQGSKVRISYDFMNRSGEGLPNPAWVGERHHIVTYDVSTDPADNPETRNIHAVYWGHGMTGLAEDDREEDEQEAVVRSLEGLMEQGRKHIHNRSILQELYNEMDTRQQSEQDPLYRQPVHLIVSLWKLRTDPQEEIGDKTSWLLRDVLEQNDAKPGDCVFQTMIDQFGRMNRSPLTDSIQEIREKCGIAKGGVSYELMNKIEEVYRWKGTNCRSQERSLGFCVFDHRLNLRRLPPYRERDSNYKYFCDIVCFNGHAYAFKDANQARDRRRQSLSYFEAVLRASKGCQKVVKKGGKEHSDLYKEAYELFRETQHLQPDVGLIQEYLNEKFGWEVSSAVVQHNATKTQKTWIPKAELPEKKVIPQYIKAKGLQARCNKLGIQTCNASRHWKEIKEMGLTFPEKTFDMSNVISMDIETCSVMNSGGRFMTYAVGWRFKGEYCSLVAETEAELESNTILWRAIEEWNKLADELVPQEEEEDDDGPSFFEEKKPKKKRAPVMYIYAHNGSRFDAVACIQTILANSPDVPTDQLESNGKFISFAYKNLVFRDSCLITMSSLKNAANSYGVLASKGYLPHGYLQNCESTTEILERINRDVTWRELEPYMDWFTDAKDEDLHERKAGRTWEQWRDEQPLRKEFQPDKVCHFRQEMEEYLRQDVECLHQIVEAVGASMAEMYGADIRTKCTLGSLAEHVWQHSLLKKIPKLETEEQHKKWQNVNRGGFCGPLATFDTRAGKKTYEKAVAEYEMKKALGEDAEKPSLKYIYKVDVTSLYPASAGAIIFETTAGVQEPLKKYYTGFPDPTNGWLQHDFEGAQMTKEHYKQLKGMHGLVKIDFDQSSLKFPFFLKKMTCKSWGTLAPVLKGSEYFTTPHVRMAFDYGVRIKLYDCEYTTQTREPYGEYMGHFAKMKNGADADKKKAEKELKGEVTERREKELDSAIRKAEFDRTLAKLFLNGLLGRNNMKIE